MHKGKGDFQKMCVGEEGMFLYGWVRRVEGSFGQLLKFQYRLCSCLKWGLSVLIKGWELVNRAKWELSKCRS